MEQVARGITPRSQNVEFWVKDGERLLKVDALLPSSGSLGPLFFAFGLITEEELQAGTGRADVSDTNFLDWLRQTVNEAVKMAEQHESLKQRIRELRANIEHKYSLASLQVGAAGGGQQQQAVAAAAAVAVAAVIGGGGSLWATAGGGTQHLRSGLPSHRLGCLAWQQALNKARLGGRLPCTCHER